MAGPVEDVVVRTSKKQKGSALAVMTSLEGAQAAVGSIAGSLASPLLVVPYRAKVGPFLITLHHLEAFIPACSWNFDSILAAFSRLLLKVVWSFCLAPLIVIRSTWRTGNF